MYMHTTIPPISYFLLFPLFQPTFLLSSLFYLCPGSPSLFLTPLCVPLLFLLSLALTFLSICPTSIPSLPLLCLMAHLYHSPDHSPPFPLQSLFTTSPFCSSFLFIFISIPTLSTLDVVMFYLWTYV